MIGFSLQNVSIEIDKHESFILLTDSKKAINFRNETFPLKPSTAVRLFCTKVATSFVSFRAGLLLSQCESAF